MGFSDLFASESNDSLPGWLQQGAAILDSGIDLYGEIAGGNDRPPLPPMQTQNAAPATPYASLLTPGVMIVVLVAALILLQKKR